MIRVSCVKVCFSILKVQTAVFSCTNIRSVCVFQFDVSSNVKSQNLVLFVVFTICRPRFINISKLFEVLIFLNLVETAGLISGLTYLQYYIH